jgi:protein ImuB
MGRIVSVWLPLLPIERLKRQRRTYGRTPDTSGPDQCIPKHRPFALVATEERGLKLTAINALSATNGLHPGMGLADARAICPLLLTLPADLEKDAGSLRALARWSSRYSPALNTDGEDGLWLDVTGVPHLFGGEAEFLADIERRLQSLGFSARLALAPTLGGAHALARFEHASQIIVPEGKIRSALAALPVEALRLEPDTVSLLKRLGLKRIGQLYDLPRASLERRFHSKDAAAAVLDRLDQALGTREEPRAPLFPAPCYEAALPFSEPLITHEGVAAALDQLARELCRRLSRGRMGARRTRLVLDRADGSFAAIEAGLSAPSREPLHLLRLLEDKIGTLDLGFGVDLMRLTALVAEPLPLAQTSFAETRERTAPEPLIDRLANRLGASAVRRLYSLASHLPERAQQVKGALTGAPSWTETEPTKPPRPALLFARPEPLHVLAEIPEGPPARFTWRLVTRRVVKAEGPERIAPEWWRKLLSRSGAANTLPPLDGEGGEAKGRSGWGETESRSPPPAAFGGTLPTRGRDARPRDYYRIEDEDGHRYWVFREGLYQEGELPSWYLHGVFG